MRNNIWKGPAADKPWEGTGRHGKSHATGTQIGERRHEQTTKGLTPGVLPGESVGWLPWQHRRNLTGAQLSSNTVNMDR